MFTKPKTWVQGESGVRAESVNRSLPENLEAVRSLSSSYTAVSAHYQNSVLTFPTVFTEGASFNYTFPSMYENPGSAAWNTPIDANTTYVGASSQASIVWIPMASLLAAKKSNESLYWNIQVTARPVAYVYGKMPAGTPIYGRLYEIASKAAFQYLGSTVDSTASATIRTADWNPLYGTGSTPLKTYWGTGNIPIDTQDMSTTNVDICAFRVMLRMYCSSDPNFVLTLGAKDFALNVTVGIG